MDINVAPLDKTLSWTTKPTKARSYTGEMTSCITAVTVTPHIDTVGGQSVVHKPITAEGEGVRISPRQMNLGEPYIFRFGGTYLIAVKQGEEHVDVYTIPQS